MLPTVEQALLSSPIYGRLTAGERRRVAEASTLRSYRRGQEIFTEGAPSTHLYTLVSGKVKVFKRTPAGKELILEIFGAGDPFGAVAVYEGRPYPASAEALTSAVCLVTDAPVFLSLLERHPHLVRSLLSGLNLRLVHLTNRLAEVTGGRVEERMARLFLKLAARMGRPWRDGVLVPLPLSRQDLADLAGITIETAIRLMSRWGKERIVLTRREGFVVADRAALEELAGEAGSPPSDPPPA